MKKRVLLVVAAMSLLVAVGLTGCGGTTVADPNAASSAAAPTASMALSEVSEDNLNGMITYLKGNGVIKEATTDMKAEMIGAVSGKMVQAIYGDSVALVEIYEFDKNNLNELAQEVIQNGKFKSMDGELTATLSNNEKYLMIYKDVYTDDTNRPIQERLLTLFKEFEPTGTSSSADNSASSTENSSESQDQENNSTSSATAESAAQ